MKNYRSFLLILLFTSMTHSAFATVDYLTVNHTTKQLYWAKTDHSPGWIGWEYIPEGQWEMAEKEYLAKGYTFTTNPYLIDQLLFAIIFAVLVALRVIRRVNKRKNTTTV